MNRNRLLWVLLFLGVLALVIELFWLMPVVLTRWYPYDYHLYVGMGEQILQGENPYGLAHYWPLPTILWVFVPLSFMPDAFVLFWIFLPIISLLVIHKKDGLLLLLFTPLWTVIRDAMIDGIMLLPTYWLLQDVSFWAGVAGVGLLAKPQLALFAVGGRFIEWLRFRKWPQVKVFLVALFLFVIPSFLIRPDWPISWLKVLPMRAAETTAILPLATGSVWSWWALGIWGKIVAVFLIVIAIGLFLRAWRAGNRTVALLMVGLFFTPFLFASNLFIAAAALKGRRQIELVTALSLFAYLVHRTANPFAGFFALIPLLILWFSNSQTTA